MTNFLLFQTTDPVIEILWDIALAFFVVRLALLYAALTFGSALAAAALLPLLFHYPFSNIVNNNNNNTALLPLLVLISSTLWARYLTAHYEVPRVLAFRFAVGVTAAVVVMVVEAVVGVVLYETGEWMGGLTGVGGWKGGLGVMGVFAMMPVLMMGVERWGKVQEGKGKGKGERTSDDVMEKRRESL